MVTFLIYLRHKQYEQVIEESIVWTRSTPKKKKVQEKEVEEEGIK